MSFTFLSQVRGYKWCAQLTTEGWDRLCICRRGWRLFPNWAFPLALGLSADVGVFRSPPFSSLMTYLRPGYKTSSWGSLRSTSASSLWDHTQPCDITTGGREYIIYSQICCQRKITVESNTTQVFYCGGEGRVHCLIIIECCFPPPPLKIFTKHWMYYSETLTLS